MAIGARSTRQRAAVASVLEGQTEFRTAQEIHQALRESGAAVGLTTVYRTLQALADSAERYVYVSSRSVYRWPPSRGADETAPLVAAEEASRKG